MLPFLYFERNEKDVKAVEKCKNIAACPLSNKSTNFFAIALGAGRPRMA